MADVFTGPAALEDLVLAAKDDENEDWDEEDWDEEEEDWEDDWDDEEYLYCTEFLLLGDGIDRASVHDFVVGAGGSELVVGEGSVISMGVFIGQAGDVAAAAPADLPVLAATKDWEQGAIRDYTTNNAYGLGRESGAQAGFTISVLPNGAWTWNAGDGKRRVDEVLFVHVLSFC